MLVEIKQSPPVVPYSARPALTQAQSARRTSGSGTGPHRPAEADLIHKALEHDLSAFNALVLMHQDGLYGWLLSLVGDEALADDLTQATFITAYEKLASYRGGSFRSWLFAIARNRAIDTLRRQKRYPALSLDATDDDDRDLYAILPDPALLPEQALEARQQAETIANLIRSLPEVFQQVLQLIDIEDFDYQEAADTLGLPLGTVKSRLARARLRMRVLLLETNFADMRSTQ